MLTEHYHFHTMQSGGRLASKAWQRRPSHAKKWKIEFTIPTKLQGGEWHEYQVWQQLVFKDIADTGAKSIAYVVIRQ